MKKELEEIIGRVVSEIQKSKLWNDFEMPKIVIEYPKDSKFGDYTTNIAMMLAGKVGKTPMEIAEEIKREIEKGKNSEIKKVEIANPGYINFYLSNKYFTKTVEKVLRKKDDWGKINKLKGKIFVAEHTDPNLFKEFHIGHIMTNAIGESLGRIAGFAGAEVKQVTFQGDVGLHIAKTLWGMESLKGEAPKKGADIWAKQAFLGKCYAWGEKNYSEEGNDKAREEMIIINKNIYSKENKYNKDYELGKKWSLEYFESIYELLGSSFDHYFLESETFEDGERIVKKNIGKVFKESEGAVIFPGSEYKLHDRVFISSEGLPTYEAKDIGLFYKKWKKYSPDISLTITGGEQKEYFQVVKKAAGMINEEWDKKTVHIAHGTLRLKSGKMSSRKGEIIRAKKWIEDTTNTILEKMNDSDVPNKNESAQKIAIAAIKYSILSVMAGKDIVYDEKSSTSFEGNSGPYLQYSYVRANSVLNKIKNYKRRDFVKLKERSDDAPKIEKMISRFPKVVEKSLSEYSPHVVANYLYDLSSEFNSFYAKIKIADESNREYKNNVALTEAVKITLKNGLYLLGIETVEKM